MQWFGWTWYVLRAMCGLDRRCTSSLRIAWLLENAQARCGREGGALEPTLIISHRGWLG